MSTSAEEQYLDRISDAVFQKIHEGIPLQKLSWPEQVVAIIYSAQPVIDNGGLLYFFESAWPENPPYTLFVDAYQAIGVEEIGKCIGEVAASFPFSEPHLHQDERRSYLDKHYSDETGALAENDEFAVSSETVFAHLAVYAREQGLASTAGSAGIVVAEIGER